MLFCYECGKIGHFDHFGWPKLNFFTSTVAKSRLTPKHNHKTHTAKHNHTQNTHREPTATRPSTSFAISPWQHLPWTQLLVPPIPIGQRQARGVGLALSTIGSLVWGAKKRPIKKQRDGRGLDLRWPRFDGKKQQSTRSWRQRWEGCWRGGARRLERVGGHCLIVPGNDWNDSKINK